MTTRWCLLSSGLLFVVVYICCALIKGVVEAGFADDGTEILTGLGSFLYIPAGWGRGWGPTLSLKGQGTAQSATVAKT